MLFRCEVIFSQFDCSGCERDVHYLHTLKFFQRFVGVFVVYLVYFVVILPLKRRIEKVFVVFGVVVGTRNYLFQLRVFEKVRVVVQFLVSLELYSQFLRQRRRLDFCIRAFVVVGERIALVDFVVYGVEKHFCNKTFWIYAHIEHI